MYLHGVCDEHDVRPSEWEGRFSSRPPLCFTNLECGPRRVGAQHDVDTLRTPMCSMSATKRVTLCQQLVKLVDRDLGKSWSSLFQEPTREGQDRLARRRLIRELTDAQAAVGEVLSWVDTGQQ